MVMAVSVQSVVGSAVLARVTPNGTSIVENLIPSLGSLH